LTQLHGDHALQATTFPKEHGVRPTGVVESKRICLVWNGA
jgi:hypothetical protein